MVAVKEERDVARRADSSRKKRIKRSGGFRNLAHTVTLPWPPDNTTVAEVDQAVKIVLAQDDGPRP